MLYNSKFAFRLLLIECYFKLRLRQGQWMDYSCRLASGWIIAVD